MSASVSVDFPAPGAPVMPIVYAWPVWENSDATAAIPTGPPCSTSEISFAIAPRS
jgi:hypothetical protein